MTHIQQLCYYVSHYQRVSSFDLPSVLSMVLRCISASSANELRHERPTACRVAPKLKWSAARPREWNNLGCSMQDSWDLMMI